MIAYHFPPLLRASGIQRTLRFVQHLPALGWQPIVLTPDVRAYPEVGDDLLAEIPPEVPVHRAFALDASRHLAWRGKYLQATALPDRWVSWKFAAVRAGLRLIEQYRPQLLWSTYPIATAHLIGAELQRRSGLPWVADFRDPMLQDDYPTDARQRRSFLQVEQQAFQRAASCVFTTAGAAAAYRRRYPEAAPRIAVIENGYDENSFSDVDKLAPLQPGRLTLLHSGTVYPHERDPRPLLQALRQFRESGRLRPETFCLRFRASAHDELLQRLAGEYAVADLIEILPPLPYRAALAEMQRADALLLMQAGNCNAQIPAKLYEYLRAGRPILALTDAAGDTAATLRAAGIDTIEALDSVEALARFLPAALAAVQAGTAPLPEIAAVRAASRQARGQELAALFERLTAARI